jgi:DNA repair photolyase
MTTILNNQQKKNVITQMKRDIRRKINSCTAVSTSSSSYPAAPTEITATM